jgi:cation/acetate symporter
VIYVHTTRNVYDFYCHHPQDHYAAGAVTGMAVGLLASIGIILVSPSLMAVDPPTVTGTARHLIQAKAIFPLENPDIYSASRLASSEPSLGTLLSHEPSSEHKFNELLVRSNGGLGAEQSGAH